MEWWFTVNTETHNEQFDLNTCMQLAMCAFDGQGSNKSQQKKEKTSEQKCVK